MTASKFLVAPFQIGDKFLDRVGFSASTVRQSGSYKVWTVIMMEPIFKIVVWLCQKAKDLVLL